MSSDVAADVSLSSVSPSRHATPKLLLVIVSVLADFLMSGIIYGYSGIVPELTTITKAFVSKCDPGDTLPCLGQIKALTAAFTIGVSTVSASGIVVGLILDWAGPRYTTILGSVIFGLGLGAFAAAPGVSDSLYYAAFFLLSLGGPFFLSATMNFAELYPPVSSAIISAQNGAFDASSAVMFAMGKMVSGLGFSFSAIMVAYLSVPGALIVIAALFFPDVPFGVGKRAKKSTGTGDSASEPEEGGEMHRNYRIRLAIEREREAAAAAAVEPAVHSLTKDVATEALFGAATNSFEEEDDGSGEESLAAPLLASAAEAGGLPVSPAGHGGTGVAPVTLATSLSHWLPKPPDIYNSDIKKQLCSGVFWALLFVASYLVTRSNFYIASINQQLRYAAVHHATQPLSPSEARQAVLFYIDIFNYIMPIGGALSVPLSGWLMVQFGLTTTFLLIGAFCCSVSVIQILATVLPLEFQIVGFVLFSIVRAVIFGAIAAFLGQIFGFRNFGRLFGVNRGAGAIVTVLQYPLIRLAEHQLHGDYQPILFGFLAVEIGLTIAWPIYLWKKVFYGNFFIRPLAANT